jgi:mono/diheme cytochrome c family protein
MLKRLTLASMAAALVACMGYAQTTNNVTIPVTKTPATSGKQMFVNYCAPCHGVDGTGQGPVPPR